MNEKNNILFYEDSEFGYAIANMSFDGLPSITLNVTEFSAEEREIRINSLYRQIRRSLDVARERGRQEIRSEMREVLGIV